MTTLATTFRAILSGLQAVIGIVAAKNPARDQILGRIYVHLNRTIQRFEKLVAHWRNNTLPKPRVSRPSPARPQSTPILPTERRPIWRLPTGRAWLIRNVDHYNFRGHASQLQYFLATPECVAFLAEVPRAHRLLRPLAKSLGIQMPGDPPPPLPKPAKPAKHPCPPPLREQPRAAPPPLTIHHPIFSKAR